MSNLALSLAPLIGRQNDLRACVALLTRTRLLTLTGPGGCGKTSLALQIASALRDEYAGGAWVVELAPLDDPASAPEAVYSVLRAGGACGEESAALSPQEQVITHLRDRNALLVLDNCEHVVSACADFVEAVLRACPQVRILATSREALKCQEETEWITPCLELPPADVFGASEGYDAAELRTYPAIALFIERARAAVSTFDLTAENAERVVRICQRLDGLPLALELAARYVKTLSLREIEDAIIEDRRLLARGRRTAPERQRTLQATVEWSYRLLAGDDQTLFCQLSLLAGDFGLPLAEAISDLPREQVIASLSALIDASLVQVIRGKDEIRYRMLETIRQVGRRLLDRSGAGSATFERYCRWAESRVEVGIDAPGGDGARLWFDDLERERDHLRAALRQMRAQGDIERGLRFATQLTPFWRQRGYIPEGRRWLETFLAQCDSAPTSPLFARAYNSAGVLALWQGDYERARTCHEAALSILQENASAAPLRAMTQFRLGFLAEKRGDYALAVQHLEQSILLYREIGGVAGEQMARSRLGLVYHRRGDHLQGQECLEASLDYYRSRNDAGATASLLLNLGIMALERGHTRRATSLLEESLALNQQVGDRFAALYCRTYLGFTSLLRNDVAKGEAWFRQAFEAPRAEGARELLVRLLDGAAIVSARRGDPISAARLWGSLSALCPLKEMGYCPAERRLHDRALAAARLDAPASAFDGAWEEGATLSLDTALARAAAWFRRASNASRVTDAPVTVPSRRPAPELRVKALGAVSVWRDEQELLAADFVYTKARELLLYLLNSPGRTKEQICLALWPDADEAHASMNFRVVIYHLRRALGRQDWILRAQSLYSINRTSARVYEYDVDVFASRLAEAEQLRLTQPARACALLEEAVALYTGEFAENLGALEWTAPLRDALRRSYHGALLGLATLHLAQGEVHLALATFQTLTTQNKYEEEAHRGVIRCYVQLHDFSRAADYYQRLCAMFQEELNISPSPITRAALQPAER